MSIPQPISHVLANESNKGKLFRIINPLRTDNRVFIYVIPNSEAQGSAEGIFLSPNGDGTYALRGWTKYSRIGLDESLMVEATEHLKIMVMLKE